MFPHCERHGTTIEHKWILTSSLKMDLFCRRDRQQFCCVVHNAWRAHYTSIFYTYSWMRIHLTWRMARHFLRKNFVTVLSYVYRRCTTFYKQMYNFTFRVSERDYSIFSLHIWKVGKTSQFSYNNQKYGLFQFYSAHTRCVCVCLLYIVRKWGWVIR